MRRLTVLVVLLLVACAATTPGTDLGGGIGSLPPRARAGSPATGSTARQTGGVSVPGGQDGPVHSGEPSRAPAAFSDSGAVGAAAAAYLRASPARRLVVEIDYVPGRAPSSAALTHLRSILDRETDKPGGVTISVDDQITGVGSGGTWSLAQIIDAERRHRDSHSGGDVATMWIAYLDGAFAQASSALGVSYESTGAAIFKDQIRGAATALIRADEIEEAALTHEAGHLLGLINLFAKSRYDHEDPDHPGHSRYDTSVMYWAIEDVSISSILTGGPPTDFDRYDRADLAAIRGS